MARSARKCPEQISVEDELGQALVALAREDKPEPGARERILDALGATADAPPISTPSPASAGLSAERMTEWCIRGRTRRR